MERLICEVQGRNILWNKKNPGYKDRLSVDKEWDAVAHSTGFSKGNVSHIEASQESQTSLLDNDDIEDEQFSDENSANVDFSSQVSVTADISQVVAKDGISKVNTNRGSLRVNKSPRELVSEATNMSSSSTATSRLKRTSRREENIAVEQQLLNIETKKLALLQTPEDENSLFLRSLLPYFQKMDPLQQLRVRNKFQETLINEMSPPFTNLQPGNTHYPDRPSTASSVHSSTYSNVCSPPTTSFQAGNTQYYSDCPITAGSSLHSSTYLDVSSPPSTAQETFEEALLKCKVLLDHTDSSSCASTDSDNGSGEKSRERSCNQHSDYEYYHDEDVDDIQDINDYSISKTLTPLPKTSALSSATEDPVGNTVNSAAAGLDITDLFVPQCKCNVDYNRRLIEQFITQMKREWDTIKIQVMSLNGQQKQQIDPLHSIFDELLPLTSIEDITMCSELLEEGEERKNICKYL
ncbi:hypothetical protein RN001_003719 [Aquatica leii]|uniref:BESS domain-containing protein n=1 Tax=Aquatica leii TaxID=1421715 RepID=A0AAN7QP92_9COLE|nr:hypothetical protein RN001_003719 [Aquatica leii]